MLIFDAVERVFVADRKEAYLPSLKRNNKKIDYTATTVSFYPPPSRDRSYTNLPAVNLTGITQSDELV